MRHSFFHRKGEPSPATGHLESFSRPVVGGVESASQFKGRRAGPLVT